MEPYLYTVVELQCITDRHYKFYRGYVDHQANEVFYQYGRIGSEGSWTDYKAFDSFEAANDAMMKQLRSKFPKGYRIVSTVNVTCAQKVAYGYQLHNELERLNHRRMYDSTGAPATESLVIANI